MSGIKTLLRGICYSAMRLLPVKRNRVLFFSYYGAQYSCNPRYISEAMVGDEYAGIERIWALGDPKKHTLPEGIRCVRTGSPAYYLALATARVVVTNYRTDSGFIKRRGQYYIQTWHSSLRLKKIEGDAQQTLTESYIGMAKADSEKLDFLISGCRFSTDIFRRAFWYDGEIWETGTPRCDMFFRPFPGREELCEQLGADPEKKLLLYAPTFRKGGGTDMFRLDFKALSEAFSRRFGGEWQVLLRLHPHLMHSSAALAAELGVKDATGFDDGQLLLAASDALITDYSSLMFDFAFTGRPLFLYTPDYDEYISRERGLYFEIDGLPFGRAVTQTDLIAMIDGYNDADYRASVAGFNEKTGSFEDGLASKRVAEKIRELTSK